MLCHVITLHSNVRPFRFTLIISLITIVLISQDSQSPAPTAPLLVVLKSKKILLRVALIAVCFFCCLFIYNGTIVNTQLWGSMYLNFSVLMLVAIPTRIVTAITLTRFGRKAPICVAYVLCAIFYIASAFIPHGKCFVIMVW